MKEQLIAFDGGGNSDGILKWTVKSSVLRRPRFLLRSNIMIGIIFVHMCVQKGDEWCRSNTSVDLFKANRQRLEIWHVRIVGDWMKIHTQNGRDSMYVSRLVPARRRSSSLQRHPSLSNLTFQHIYQHMPWMNTDIFSSQLPSFISPFPSIFRGGF